MPLVGGRGSGRRGRPVVLDVEAMLAAGLLRRDADDLASAVLRLGLRGAAVGHFRPFRSGG